MAKPDDIPEEVWDAAQAAHAQFADSRNPDNLGVVIARAIMAERNRCAAIADKHLARIPNHHPDHQGDDLVAYGYGNAALNIAKAIRGEHQ